MYQLGAIQIDDNEYVLPYSRKDGLEYTRKTSTRKCKPKKYKE